MKNGYSEITYNEIKILFYSEAGMGGGIARRPQEGACQKLHLCCITSCSVHRP